MITPNTFLISIVIVLIFLIIIFWFIKRRNKKQLRKLLENYNTDEDLSKPVGDKFLKGGENGIQKEEERKRIEGIGRGFGERENRSSEIGERSSRGWSRTGDSSSTKFRSLQISSPKKSSRNWSRT